MKLGLDALSAGEPATFAILCLFGTGLAQTLRVYFQGKRIIVNSRLTRLVYLETSAKVFHCLLNFDWYFYWSPNLKG